MSTGDMFEKSTWLRVCARRESTVLPSCYVILCACMQRMNLLWRRNDPFYFKARHYRLVVVDDCLFDRIVYSSNRPVPMKVNRSSRG